MKRKTSKANKQQAAAAGPQAFVYGVAASAALGAVAVVTSVQIAVGVLAALALVAGYYFVSTRPRLNSRLRRLTGGNLQTVVFGAVVIVAISFAGARFLPASFAWHPEGKITKTVKNITAGGPEVDANDAASALQARPGDILEYTVIVSNTAEAANNSGNDMAYTVLVEDMPSGVQLVDDTNVSVFSESLGTILPGNSVTRKYKVKVLSSSVGDVLDNKACFTANIVVKDNPQSGCEHAMVTVSHSDPTPTPSPTPTPEPTTTPTPTVPATTGGGGGEQTPAPSPNPTTSKNTDAPERLVNAGPGGVVIIALFGVLGGYIAHEVYRRTRQTQ